ncbi:RDD family protein [Streptomyces sp. NPDC000410]|uniref:RDD family protein n=1 Tax=Streptomyces sp. NPDC000410 TaxID=3154254 RepID=UPI003333076E
MSAPTPATGDGSPTPGFYPDPSIPGYIRYWNGSAWVPGTSRPAPKDGEAMPTPPPSAARPAAAASAASVASVEETGPVFLDEDPEPPASPAPEPASAWQADAAQQSGFGGDRDRRVSWGSSPQDPRAAGAPGADRSSAPAGAEGWGSTPASAAPRAAQPDPRAGGAPTDQAAAGWASGAGQPARSAGTPAGAQPDPTGGALPGVRNVGATPPADGTMTIRALAPQRSQPKPQSPPQPQVPGQVPAQQQPQPEAPVQPHAPARHQPPAAAAATPVSPGAGGGAASWPQQVHQLAQSGPQAAEEPPVLPWKPPVNDPFLQAAQAQAAARPAGLGKRLVARLIDSVVLGALVGAVSTPFVSKALTHIDQKIQAAKMSGETVTVWLLDGTTATQFGIALAALLVLGVLYEALPTAKWGFTLGKKLMGLEVRDIEAHEPPAFGAALRRWLVYGILGVLVIGVVNALWCLFDRPWRQCWHDKVARTFVSG